MSDPNEIGDCYNPATGAALPVLRLPCTQALADVLLERQRQDAKWGVQNHQPIIYIAILTEEVGELAKECVEKHFSVTGPTGPRLPRTNLRTEAIHVAAVALAMVECIDRNGQAS